MEQKKTDRRILRTRRMIDDAMMSLLEEKPIHEIGVTELCERADINRNTFYCHYNSPLDVLEHLEQTMLARISEAFSAHTSSEDDTEITLLAFSEEKRLAMILLSAHVGDHFSSRIIRAARERGLTIASRQASKLSASYQTMLSDFDIAGGAAIIRRWAEDGMKEPPKDVAKFIRIVSNYGSNDIQKKPDPEFR